MKAEEKTRALILNHLLRNGPATVPDLGGALSLTNNAVRFHLESLLLNGSVVPVGQRKPEGAGKPAMVYGLSQTAHTGFSRAYAPVLAALAQEVATSLPREKTRFMHRVGKRLAADIEIPQGTLAQRVRAASDLLNSLGGVTEVHRNADGFTIQSMSCPVGEAVSAEPCVCHAIESLVGHVTGAVARERCDRSGRPKCCFQISEAPVPVRRRKIA